MERWGGPRTSVLLQLGPAVNQKRTRRRTGFSSFSGYPWLHRASGRSHQSPASSTDPSMVPTTQGANSMRCLHMNAAPWTDRRGFLRSAAQVRPLIRKEESEVQGREGPV